MKVCFVCGYYSDLAHKHIARRREDWWNAHFFVWGVKVGSFKRNFYVIVRSGKRVRIRKDNFSEARQMFGRFVANRIVENKWDDNPVLVPVPSKDATLDAVQSRNMNMVIEAMHSTAYAASVVDALRWTERLGKAHEGGERRREHIKPYLEVIEDLQGRNIVLIDDLLTRGGTMLASRDKLIEAGANVLGAITCGRTIYDFETKAFGRQEIELQEELADFDHAVIR